MRASALLTRQTDTLEVRKEVVSWELMKFCDNF
jgi:hypothetical protein